MHNDLRGIEQTLERLTPGEKLSLIERLARSLRAEASIQSSEQRHQALNRFRQELATLPVVNPSDGFSNREHDNLLYGNAS